MNNSTPTKIHGISLIDSYEATNTWPSLIAGLDYGLDHWTGLLDWITGSNQNDDVRRKMWLRRIKGASSRPW